MAIKYENLYNQRYKMAGGRWLVPIHYRLHKNITRSLIIDEKLKNDIYIDSNNCVRLKHRNLALMNNELSLYLGYKRYVLNKKKRLITKRFDVCFLTDSNFDK
jgi:hypothetical protein